MELKEFHNRLFGRDPGPYLLNGTHCGLYELFTGGMRGVRFDQAGCQDQDRFLAVFVHALFQTSVPDPGEVALIIPPALFAWSQTQVKNIMQHLIKIRVAKGDTRDDLAPLVDASSRLVLIHKPFQLQGPPARWSSYGLTETPNWAEQFLVHVPY